METMEQEVQAGRRGGGLVVAWRVLVLVLVLVSLQGSGAVALQSHLFPRGGDASHDPRSRDPVRYETLYWTQEIDHFGFFENGTFKQRYLVADQHWRMAGGPILFYTGNEGDITWFCNNTGFMWQIAEELGAMLVFAEHRYYGDSLPFGPDSYSDSKHLNYLSSEQALADFAALIRGLKRSVPGASRSPVIAVGGSYGGMLAAWLRMKYPSQVVGALAASAPIWQFPDMVPCGDFYRIVSQDFAAAGPNCGVNIRRSWSAIDNIASTAEGLAWLSGTFGLCSPLKTRQDSVGFKGWLQETWVNLAMVDYPYEANFLQPLPAWPIQGADKSPARLGCKRGSPPTPNKQRQFLSRRTKEAERRLAATAAITTSAGVDGGDAAGILSVKYEPNAPADGEKRGRRGGEAARAPPTFRSAGE
ncbi:unnamed protein product [Merluccius merluccius]